MTLAEERVCSTDECSAGTKLKDKDSTASILLYQTNRGKGKRRMGETRSDPVQGGRKEKRVCRYFRRTRR